MDKKMDRKKVQDYYFGNSKNISDKILFIKRENRLSLYSQYLTSVEKFGNVWRGITGNLNGEKVSVIGTGVGPSMVGDCVLALDKPESICIFSGTCGSLDDKLDIGDYFLADYAYCGDGYSPIFNHISSNPSVLPYPYLTVSQANKTLFELLKKSFEKNKKPYHQGVSFTTSSVVIETDEKFWRIVSPNARIIEMSCAPFYSAAMKTRKKAAAYFWVTDLPRNGKSYFDELSQTDLLKRQRTFDNIVSLDMAILSGL